MTVRESILTALNAALQAQCAALVPPVPVDYLRRNPVDQDEEAPRVNLQRWQASASGDALINCDLPVAAAIDVVAYIEMDAAPARVEAIRAAVHAAVRSLLTHSDVTRVRAYFTDDGVEADERGLVVTMRYSINYMQPDTEPL